MKIKLFPQGAGLYGLAVIKTRRDENPTRLVGSIKKEDLRKVLSDTMREVEPAAQPLPLVSS